MSQNDLTIANQGFASFRSDLNSALQALGSTNSGTSAPSTTFANQLFYDTSNNILKIRNEDNDAFISLFTLDQTNDNIESLTINGVFTVAGNISQTDGDFLYSGGGNFDIKHNTASQNILFHTTPSGGSAIERMRIAHTGQVSIGTTDITFGFNVGGSGSDIRGKFQGNNQYRLGLQNGTNNMVLLGSGGADNFRVSNAAGSTKLEMDSSGNFYVHDGNLVLGTSGKGIDFSANANASSMSSELLDDYEEGTFSHTVSNFGGSQNSGFNVGDYTKIGNKVFIHGAIVYDSGSVTGTTALFGLPFVIENVNEGHTIISYNGTVASTTIHDNRRGSPNASFFEIGVTSGSGTINLVYHAMYTTA